MFWERVEGSEVSIAAGTLDAPTGLVTAGHMGRKSGRGFYDYSQDQPVPMDRLHEGD